MAYTTIDDPSEYFQIALYTGSGSDNTITNDGNSNLKPDLLWVKCRSSTQDHMLFDSSRGFNGDGDSLYLEINADAETHNDNDHLKSFNTDGFTMQGASSRSNKGDGSTYVAFQWKINEGTRTTNSESGNNPGGGYQVNTTSGVSIVDYTGTGGAGTMAHGLGAVPEAIFVHDRGGNDHPVYHKKAASDPETDYFHFNDNVAPTDDSGRWNDTAPTSTVFSLGTNNEVNGDGRTYLAWLFRSIQGFSKVGVYKGNNNGTNAPFINTGFKPAFVMFKRASIEDWGIVNIKSSPRATGTKTNDMAYQLEANGTGAESNQIDFWFCSNGFRLDGSGAFANGDDETYIYIAFAEQPFVTSGGTPCTAL